MLVSQISYLVAFTSLSVATINAADSTLRFVHAVWRHGDRSPDIRWPTDTVNTEDSWPQGFGELTTLGMQQQYALGQYIRHRYDGFIKAEYDKYQVYIRSTDVNRTIMSAQVNLAGMFPPDPKQSWNLQIPWQPVPVHVVERHNDPFTADCPNYNTELEAVAAWPEVASIDAANAEFYKFLSEKTGIPMISFLQIGAVWGPYQCLQAHSNDTCCGEHQVPDWVNDTIVARMAPLVQISIKYALATPIMQQIRAGPIVRDMLNRMEQRRSSNESVYHLRYFAYSAVGECKSHDASISSILRALDTPSFDQIIPYNGLLLLELHETADSQWTVRLFYRNSTETEDPSYELSIGGCGDPCTLDKFRLAFTFGNVKRFSSQFHVQLLGNDYEYYDEKLSQRSAYLFVDVDWASVCGQTSWVVVHGHAIIITLLVIVAIMLVLLTTPLVIMSRRYRKGGQDGQRPPVMTSYPPYTPVVDWDGDGINS